MFKKITFLLISAMAFSANAQFTIDEDTLYAYGFAAPNSTDFVDIYAHTVIRSTNSQSEAINWNRVNVSYPNPGWTTAICDIISCRAPEVSSDSFRFMNGGDTGILSFHFYTKNFNGEGWMTVRFSRVDFPLQYVDVVINAKAWNPVGIQSVYSNVNRLYPNPAKTNLHIENAKAENGSMRVYNQMGQILCEIPFALSADLDVSSFQSGVYTIQVVTSNETYTSRFIKE